MDDLRLGALVRTLRRRLGWRQVDLARRAGVSQSAVSRLETGHLDELSLSTIRRIAAALEITVDFAPRWRGGELASSTKAMRNSSRSRSGICAPRPGM